MRFEPIGQCRQYIPLLREECLDNLIRDFGVKSVGDDVYHLSELERVLVFGKTISRRFDFSDNSGQCMRNGSSWHLIFDHDYVFKCESGMTFMMTMPYDTHDGFYEKFDAMIHDYYERKSELTHDVNDPQIGRWMWEYKTDGWRKQFAITETMDAVIVDDRYKIRENGDFAAIIATTDTLRKMGIGPRGSFERNEANAG